MGLSKQAHDEWVNRTQAIGLAGTFGFNLVVFLGFVDPGTVGTATINLAAGAATGFSRQIFTLITGHKLTNGDTDSTGTSVSGTSD